MKILLSHMSVHQIMTLSEEYFIIWWKITLWRLHSTSFSSHLLNHSVTLWRKWPWQQVGRLHERSSMTFTHYSPSDNKKVPSTWSFKITDQHWAPNMAWSCKRNCQLLSSRLIKLDCLHYEKSNRHWQCICLLWLAMLLSKPSLNLQMSHPS